MENTDLGSILAEEATEQEQAVEAQAPEAEPTPEPTGEVAAPPAAPVVEDKQAQGLLAALAAERDRRQASDRRAAEAEARAAELSRPKHLTGEPDPNNYTDQAQYINDVVEYRTAVQRNAWEQQQAKANFDREVETRANSTIAEGRGKYPDFDTAIDALRPVLSDNFRNALVLRGGPDVAYHLAKNVADAYRISALPGPEMLLELAELRGMLKGAPAPKPEVPKVSIPQTLTQARDSRGQFQPAYDGPTPLDQVLANRA